MNTPNKKFTHKYNPEKLAEFTHSALLDMREKAIKNGIEDLASMCDFELSKRPPPPKKEVKKVSMSIPSKSGKKAAIIEADRITSALLAEAITELNKKYDLSKETARSLSTDSKKFRAHNTKSSDKAKTGGAKRNGNVVISNYVSYRLNDDIFELAALLEHNQPVSAMKFIVMAPKKYLKNWETKEKFIPMREGDKFGITEGGEVFKTFPEAIDIFTEIIDKVAPKKSN